MAETHGWPLRTRLVWPESTSGQVVQQVRQGNAEHLGNVPQIQDRDIPLAPLHRADERAVQAAALVTDFKIRPVIRRFLIWKYFVPSFVSAAEAGEGPDIAVTGSGDISAWAEAGYIMPFDDCRARYPEFDDVRDELWSLVTWEGQVWGVPVDIDQNAACAVLAKTLTPEINTLNAIESGLLGVLKSQADHPAFTQDRRLSEQRYMLDYIWREP